MAGPNDGKSCDFCPLMVVLTLTPSGRKAMESAREIFDEEFGRRLARLTQAQRVALMRIFERMA